MSTALPIGCNNGPATNRLGFNPQNFFPRWLLFSFGAVGAWGVWGALAEIPGRRGFPENLSFVLWATIMLAYSSFAVMKSRSSLRLSRRTLLLALAAGATGAGGQLALLCAIRVGSCTLILPVASLYPVVTMVLVVTVIREVAAVRNVAGGLLALPAAFLLSYTPANASEILHWAEWLPVALIVVALWGVQGLLIKLCSDDVPSATLLFYVSCGGFLVAIPAGLLVGGAQVVNWGASGFGSAAAIQLLDAIADLCLLYALKYGKALIVTPLVSLAPAVTVAVSTLLFGAVLSPTAKAGVVISLASIVLMTSGELGQRSQPVPAAKACVEPVMV